MVLKSDQERVKALLSETITLLCRNGLHFQSELSIEALIGITLDHDDVFLVSVKEVIQPNSNPVDSPSSIRKQKEEDIDMIQLDTESGDLSAASDSTPAVSGTSLSRCAGQQPTFCSDIASAEKVTDVQKRKRRRTIDSNSDGRAIESRKPADGHTFTQGRSDAQTCSDALIESSSALSITERLGSQSGVKEAYSRHEEAGAKSDIFGQDFGADVLHIKEEAFTMDDGMQYYNPPASFSAYPTQYQGMTNDANPFDTSGLPFQVSGESASHLVNEMHSQRGRDPRCHKRAPWGVRGRTNWLRLYDCSVCGRGFTSRQGRDIHRRIHDGIYRYHCIYCGKGCSGTTQLRGHMAMHAERKEFQCSACDKQYRYKQDLLNHFRKHHDDGTGPTEGVAST